MEENIQSLYEQINDKKAIVIELAVYWKMSRATVYANWFHGLKVIPEWRQEKTLDIMQRFRAKELSNEQVS